MLTSDNLTPPPALVLQRSWLSASVTLALPHLKPHSSRLLGISVANPHSWCSLPPLWPVFSTEWQEQADGHGDIKEDADHSMTPEKASTYSRKRRVPGQGPELSQSHRRCKGLFGPKCTGSRDH